MPSLTPPSSPTHNNSNNHNIDPSMNIIIDLSRNIVTNIVDISYNSVVSDMSFNIPTIITYIKNETIVEPGLEIKNKEGLTASGDYVAYTQFDTTNPELYDPQIEEKLLEKVDTYNDELNPTSENAILVSQIKDYASKIQCSDFHGKGTIDDYTELFKAASKIANESKSMSLNIDVEGFDEFSKAADDLSELFTGFIIKLQNVNIINDLEFLRSIKIALHKIWNLSEVFGKFKQTILTTTTIQFPKSAHETKVVLEGVMDEVNCAMQYITHFVTPTSNVPHDADLSTEEKNIIDKAVETIENWNVICEHGVSIAMENNPDVEFITQASNELKQTTLNLKNATNTLKSKLAAFNIC
jgi:chorismate mutase